MRILNRYLGRAIVRHAVIVMFALLALFTFVNFLDQLNDLGKGDYTIGRIVHYMVLTAPRAIYDVFPIAALLGAIVGMSLLAADSELIVMRAGGASVWQITGAALKTGAWLILAALLVGEFIAPEAETRAQRMRAESLEQNIKQQTNFGLWMRDARTYVNVGEMLPDLTLLRLKVFTFDADNRLTRAMSAARGRFVDGIWRLSDVRETRIDARGASWAKPQTSHLHEAEWETRVTPQVLSVFLVKPHQLSLRRLKHYITHLRANQQQTAPYQLAFWNKLMLPLSVGVMVMLAIPFVFANLRRGNLGRGLFAGIMLGLGFYALNKGLGYIVLDNGLPPFIGAVLPPLAFFLLALLLLGRVARGRA